MEIVKNEMIISSQDIMQYINDFCQGKGWNIDDISNQQFKALLIAVGYKFFNKNTSAIYKGNSIHNGLNYELLLYIYTMYRDICLLYNKIPSVLGYCYLVNIDYYTLQYMIDNDNGARSSRIALELIQKLGLIREDALKDRAIDKGGAVGVAIVGNNEYMWNDPQNRPLQVANNNNALLPDFTPKKAIKSI